MFRKLIQTDDELASLVALGVVMFPHGAQKVLGWACQLHMHTGRVAGATSCRDHFVEPSAGHKCRFTDFSQ